MTEARRYDCNCRTTGVHCFIGLDLRLVSPVTLVFMSQSFTMYLIIMLNPKHIDINWLFCVMDNL
jgi:hypothetical protein